MTGAAALPAQWAWGRRRRGRAQAGGAAETDSEEPGLGRGVRVDALRRHGRHGWLGTERADGKTVVNPARLREQHLKRGKELSGLGRPGAHAVSCGRALTPESI